MTHNNTSNFNNNPHPFRRQFQNNQFFQQTHFENTNVDVLKLTGYDFEINQNHYSSKAIKPSTEFLPTLRFPKFLCQKKNILKISYLKTITDNFE